MKRSFFQAAVTSILLYGCTTWTLTKRLEKKLDGNYTRMLRAILNKSWRQHPTRHQLYGHLPPITKTIQVRRTRHAGHCWRSRDELIRDVLLWTPTHGRTKAGWPARTYIQQLCEDTGCCPEDLPRAMNDREEWRERVGDIRATSAIWWWLVLCETQSVSFRIWTRVTVSISRNDNHYTIFGQLSLGLVVWPRLDVSISKHQRILYISFSRTNYGLCVYHLFVKVKFQLLAQFPVDPLLHLVVSSHYYILFFWDFFILTFGW